MFQVGAAGHHLKHSVIRDVITPGNLQAAQLRAAVGHHVQPPVSEPLAAAHHHRLQGQTHVGRVLAQPAGQDPDGPVGVEQLPRQPHGAPQPRVPRQVVPAAAHAGTATQLVGGEVGEDLQEGVVGEEVDGGVVVGFGLAGAGVGAGLRVHHGDRLCRGGGRGRGVGLMAVAGEGGRGERGGLGRQNQTRAGGAQSPGAGVETWTTDVKRQRDKETKGVTVWRVSESFVLLIPLFWI